MAMRRSLLWILAVLAVLAAGFAVTYSPEPAKLLNFADDGKSK
jgi:hypothetical protein